jgi:FtsH-binding integral membrane protein
MMAFNAPYRRSPEPYATRSTLAQGGVDAGLRSYMLGVYNRMAGGLALTGAVAYWAAASGFYAQIAGTPLIWVVLFAPFAMALFLGFRLNKMSATAANACFWSYAGLMGLSLAGIFLIYTGVSVARVFFITAGTFAAMSLYGYTTRRDLSRIGSFLIMGLIGVILASVVNLFVASSALTFAISVAGVLVFTGLTAWDTQRITQMYAETTDPDSRARAKVLGALMLYMDFVNLFISMLQLTGTRRS